LGNLNGNQVPIEEILVYGLSDGLPTDLDTLRGDPHCPEMGMIAVDKVLALASRKQLPVEKYMGARILRHEMGNVVLRGWAPVFEAIARWHEGRSEASLIAATPV